MRRKDGAELPYVEQRFDYDCGHACLVMLGHDGYALFHDKIEGVHFRDIEKHFGIFPIEQPADVQRLRDECFFPEPLLVSVIYNLDWNSRHWVVAHKDLVLCPTLGVVSADEYFRHAPIQNAYPVPCTDERHYDYDLHPGNP